MKGHTPTWYTTWGGEVCTAGRLWGLSERQGVETAFEAMNSTEKAPEDAGMGLEGSQSPGALPAAFMSDLSHQPLGEVASDATPICSTGAQGQLRPGPTPLPVTLGL